MRRFTYALALLFLCVFASVSTFGQSINAVVGGTVSDPSKALIPGVTVTATNAGTNVSATTVTNESGSYQFPALQPGTYKISAELPGFQTQTFTNVTLGGAQQVTLNFTLQVAAAAGQQVEVTVAADTVLATTSNSIGTVLPDYKLKDLPALTGNVLNLVSNVPGVNRDNSGTFGYMAGGRLGDVNATLNGVNVNDGRYENGAWSTVYTSPDLVEEVKVVVAPVDAETSRGNGQIQMVTRSGTNAYTGSLAWSNHNSSLDANDWFNNRNGVAKGYDNRNLYSARLGGPIIKNKTFFFLLFSGQRDLKKVGASGLTWTPMAKAGIFRYWPGVDSTNAGGTNPGVDTLGNPLTPKGATGPLSAIGLFGSCNFNGAPVANCKTYNSALSISQVPFLQTEFSKMPAANQFTAGDGLNTANIAFVRRQDGFDQTNGNSDEVDRDQYNARIDHNFNSRHRLSLIATNEHTWGTATQAGLSNWPTSYSGLAVKRPVVYSIQVSSTLSSTMLNQLRLGKSGSNNWQWGAADQSTALGAQIRPLLYYANGVPIGTMTFATGILPFATKGQFGRWREGINPRWSIGDDLSWTVRKHAFKGGFEWRRTESNGFNDPNITPTGTLGGGNNPLTLDSSAAGGGFTGLTPNQSTSAKNFIYDIAGQVANVNEAFGILSATNTTLQPTPIVPNNRHWNYQNEMSAYFKDDYKFRPDLTINLGIHWEWYGQPYEHNGLAARVVGNDLSAFFPTCASTPGTPIPDVPGIGDTSCTNLAQVQFVGKNSTHPDIGVNLKGNDYHSFAPAVGFAYDIPWLGKGKTVLRAGYALAYEGALRNFITVDGAINTVPGINLINGGSGITWNAPAAGSGTPVTTLANLGLPIPFPAGTPTSSPFPVTPTSRSLGITTYNYTNPYTQNWNVEIQREVAKNTTVEVRYVGTKGSKLWANVNYNDYAMYQRANALSLFSAFDSARTGGESPLLNTLFKGVGLSGTCVENDTTCTGAQILRTNATTRGLLANGSYGSLLSQLNTGLAYTGSGTTSAGQILRHAGLPDNFLTPNPQYTTVTMMGNDQNSTYHSLNLQVTRRLAQGFTNTTSFIWSKAMGAGAFVDPLDHDWKTLQGVDHKGQFSSSGTYLLPFGTGHALMGNAPGWAQRIVSGWQAGGIANYVTGAPLSYTTSVQTFSGNLGEAGRPNLVGAAPAGSLAKLPTQVTYFKGYNTIPDPGFAQTAPACATTAACNGLALGLTNRALVDPNGNVVMTNPLGGTKGNLFQNTLRGPGALYFDMNMVKRIQIQERRNLELRVDIVNVLNHPNFGDPTTSIESTSFGNIGSLRSGLNTGGNGGMRSFILNTRLNF
ncbi:MAG TPA: carboxypeptidase regulatory-like domain-containing protein [Terriglobia bacterium]|nr:carboxypeptidase regulatory-like domain-containing protein [Terriglobia bacterium]